MFIKDISGGYVNSDKVKRYLVGSDSGTYFINAFFEPTTGNQRLSGDFTSSNDANVALDKLLKILGSSVDISEL